MNRRYLIFLALFCSILFMSGLYVNLRMAFNLGWSLFYALPFSYVAFGFIKMVSGRRKGRKSPTPSELFFQRLNFICMGWVSFLFLFTVLRDIAGVIAHYINLELSYLIFSEQGATTALVLSIVTLIAGIIPALRGPHVKFVDVPVANLKPELSGLKIAQISDLHIGPFIGASYSKKVVDKIRELSPSIVALTGDIFDSDYDHFNRQALPLAALADFSKVFFVSGNHEYYWESSKWFALVTQMKMNLLRNENQIVDINGGKILIGGIVDPAAQMIGEKPDVAKAAQGTADFKLLLAHQPQIAEMAAKEGFDLQLSGHTHGGQFFPWTLVVRKVHKYHEGLFRVAERMWIYVSPGTGFWGPPVRLGTTPEITLLTLRKV